MIQHLNIAVLILENWHPGKIYPYRRSENNEDPKPFSHALFQICKPKYPSSNNVITLSIPAILSEYPTIKVITIQSLNIQP